MPSHTQDLETQDRLTKNIKDLLWLNTYAGGKDVKASDALAALEKNGAASDGTHPSNVAAILKKLAGDDALAAQASEHGFVKYVTELSLEELMAANLSGGEDTEEVMGWASGAKYTIKMPDIFKKTATA